MTERRDKRGRRIGYNWWRTHICDLLFAAETVWLNDREAVALGYATEMEEYARDNPRPTLKAFLIEQAGMHTDPQA